MFLAHPQGSLLKVLLRCWVYESNLTDQVYSQRISEFFDLAFQGLNDLTYELAISKEVNREVSDAAMAVLPPKLTK
jgi:hypothetical protein